MDKEINKIVDDVARQIPEDYHFALDELAKRIVEHYDDLLKPTCEHKYVDLNPDDIYSPIQCEKCGEKLKP